MSHACRAQGPNEPCSSSGKPAEYDDFVQRLLDQPTDATGVTGSAPAQAAALATPAAAPSSAPS
jgi:hypothetical protein